MLAALRAQLSHTHAQRLSPATFATVAAKVRQLESAAEWEDTLRSAAQSTSGVLAQFTAQWCPPCKIIAPVVEDLAAAHPAVAFVKLDIDNPALKEVVLTHGVAAVPTFVAYKGAQRGSHFTGADKAQLAAMVQQLASA